MPPNPVHPVVLDTQHTQHTAHWDALKNGGHADVAHIEAQSRAAVRRKRAARDGRDAACALDHQQAHGPHFDPRDNDAGAGDSTYTVSRPVLDPIHPRCTEVSLGPAYNLPPLAAAPRHRAAREVRPVRDRANVVVSQLEALCQSSQITLLLEDTDAYRDTVSTEPGGISVSVCSDSGHSGARTHSTGTSRRNRWRDWSMRS